MTDVCEATDLRKAILTYNELRQYAQPSVTEIWDSAMSGQLKGAPADASLDRGLWARNDQHPAWADLEDAYYLEISEGTIAVFTNLLECLGLGAPDVLELDKGVKVDLLKAKSDGALEKFKYLPKSVIKYLTDGKAWTPAQLTEIEKLLGRGLSGLKTISDKYMVKANALSALQGAFDAANATMPKLLVADLPVTIDARQRVPAPLPRRERRELERQAAKAAKQNLMPPQPEAFRLRPDRGAATAPMLPLTTLEEGAIQWAQLHAGEKIATESDMIKSKVKELVIKARQGRWSPQELERALLKQLGEFNRDWRRIAITELADCMSNGYLATLPEGAYVVGQANGDACPWCRDNIHGKVLKVVREPGDGEREVWIGKSNYGRRKAEWWPCIPAHPNCRCRWQAFNPKFSYIDKDGRVALKTRDILLAERQALKSFFTSKDVLIKSLGAISENDVIDIMDRSRWEYRNPATLGANPNQIPMLDQDKLNAVRVRFGGGEPMPPILIDRNGTILDGHHRWYVALEMGLAWVPVIVAPVRVMAAVEAAGPDPDVGATAKEAL